MQGFAPPQADRDSGSAQGPESGGIGDSLMQGMRNNPLLTGALAAGLAAVTGPQMLKALAARLGKIPAYETGRIRDVQNLIERFAPHADEATDAWKMVGGSGPTSLKYLGSGIDATAFKVTPGNTVLKLARPTTHVGFDPHQIADTAPRNVMLPVLEHGKFGDVYGNPEMSWFVQPRARPIEKFYDNDRLKQAVLRTGGTPPNNMSSVYNQLSELLRQEHPEWRIIDQHSGNVGHWAGKNWVIDLGSMEHTPTRNALRHAPEPPTPLSTAPDAAWDAAIGRGPQIPVRDTPITTPPGMPPLPETPSTHFGESEVERARNIIDRWKAGSGGVGEDEWVNALQVKKWARDKDQWTPKQARRAVSTPPRPDLSSGQIRGMDTADLERGAEMTLNAKNARNLLEEFIRRWHMDNAGATPSDLGRFRREIEREIKGPRQ